MIFGIGIDIVEIDRIRRAHARWGDRFLRRILTDDELTGLSLKKDIYPSLSARFAAKEAFLKALGTGFSRGISWHDMRIRREKGQRPFLSISGRAGEIMKELGVTDVHLSISHERHYAVAQAILEQ